MGPVGDILWPARNFRAGSPVGVRWLRCLRTIQEKNRFAFSKKPSDIGVFWSPQESANAFSFSFCSAFRLVGISTWIVTSKSPLRTDNVVTLKRPEPARPAPANDVIEIPLHGRIAAGVPIEALEGQAMLPVPAALLGAGEHYALEVSGDSMVEAGILDGDYALIRRTDTARDGEIVVALIRGDGGLIGDFVEALVPRGNQGVTDSSCGCASVRIRRMAYQPVHCQPEGAWRLGFDLAVGGSTGGIRTCAKREQRYVPIDHGNAG